MRAVLVVAGGVVSPAARVAVEAAVALWLERRVREVDVDDPLAQAWIGACVQLARLKRVDRPSDIRALTRTCEVTAFVAARLLDGGDGAGFSSPSRAA